MWHVSIGLGGKPIKAPRSALEKQAKRLAIKIMGRVGQGRVYWQLGDIAYHLRVSLSDEEMKLLPDQWCEFAPVDAGGNLEIIDSWEVGE